MWPMSPMASTACGGGAPSIPAASRGRQHPGGGVGPGAAALSAVLKLPGGVRGQRAEPGEQGSLPRSWSSRDPVCTAGKGRGTTGLLGAKVDVVVGGSALVCC